MLSDFFSIYENNLTTEDVLDIINDRLKKHQRHYKVFFKGL